MLRYMDPSTVAGATKTLAMSMRENMIQGLADIRKKDEIFSLLHPISKMLTDLEKKKIGELIIDNKVDEQLEYVKSLAAKYSQPQKKTTMTTTKTVKVPKTTMTAKIPMAEFDKLTKESMDLTQDAQRLYAKAQKEHFRLSKAMTPKQVKAAIDTIEKVDKDIDKAVEKVAKRKASKKAPMATIAEYSPVPAWKEHKGSWSNQDILQYYEKHGEMPRNKNGTEMTKTIDDVRRLLAPKEKKQRVSTAKPKMSKEEKEEKKRIDSMPENVAAKELAKAIHDVSFGSMHFIDIHEGFGKSNVKIDRDYRKKIGKGIETIERIMESKVLSDEVKNEILRKHNYDKMYKKFEQYSKIT